MFRQDGGTWLYTQELVCLCRGQGVGAPPQPAPDPCLAILFDEALGISRRPCRFTELLKLWALAGVAVAHCRSKSSPASAVPEVLDGREDGGHSRLVGDLLQQLFADQKGLDAFLDDLRHSPRDHEGRVLNVQRVLDGGRSGALVPILTEYILTIVINPAVSA